MNLPNYDQYATSNGIDEQSETDRDRWIDNLNSLDEVTKYIEMDSYDLMNFQSEHDIDFHDDDVTVKMLKIDYVDKLNEYYENNEI